MAGTSAYRPLLAGRAQRGASKKPTRFCAVLELLEDRLAPATLFWDANGATAGTGGTGVWDTTSLLWRNGSNTGALQAWVDGSDAVFEGTAGTVSIAASGVDAASISFQTTAYIVSSNTLTLSGAASISTNTNVTSTINAKISGTSGLNKLGTGSLVLSATTSDFTGTTSILAGSIRVTASVPASGNGPLGNSAGADILLGDTATSANAEVIVNTASTFARPIIVQTGTGTRTLTGWGDSSSFSGAITLNKEVLTRGLDTTGNGDRNLTLSGVISGGGGIRVTMGGTSTNDTLILSNTGNSYTGTTTILDGRLQINASVPASGNGPLGNSAGGDIVLGGAATGAALLFSVGNLTLGRNITVAAGGGARSIISGSNTASNIVSGNILLNTSLTLDTSGNRGLTISGNIDGTGNLTRSGTTNVTDPTILSGTNTFTGSITITGNAGVGGTLQIASDAALGNSANPIVIANGGTLEASNTFTLNSSRSITIQTSGTGSMGATSTKTLTYAGVISGIGNLTKSSAGTLILSGINTYTGVTTVSAGTLTVTGGNAIPDGSAVSFANTAGAVLNLTDNETVGTLTGGGGTGGNITLNANTLTVGGDNASPAAYGGLISGAGGNLTKIGVGTQALSSTTSSYTGVTTISAGTLSINNDRAVGGVPGSPTPGSIIINGGTLAASATFTLNGNRGIALGPTTGSGAAPINVATGFTLTYGGILADQGTGSGSLTKLGAGVLALTSTASSYTGGTTILAGTLSISNDQALGAVPGSAIPGSIVINGGTLEASASLTLNSNRGIALGPTSGTGAGTISVAVNAGTLTYDGIIANNGVGTGNLIKTGSATAGADGTLTLSGASSYSGSTTVVKGNLRAAANTANSVAGPVGNSSAPILLGDTSGSNPAGLQVDVGVSFGRGVIVQAGSSGSKTLGAVAAGTATIAGAVTLNDATTVNAAGAADVIEISGAINGVGSLTKTGSGTATLSGSNAYLGVTAITAGTLTAAGGNGIPNGSAVTLSNVSGATLNLAASETIGSLAGGGVSGGNVTLDVNTLSIGSDNTNTAYAGIISGIGGNLVKVGAGAFTLSTAGSFTGTATVSGGSFEVPAFVTLNSPATVSVNGTSTLFVNGSLAPVSSPLSVAAPAALAGSSFVFADVAIASGAALAPGATANTTAVLKIFGNLALAGSLAAEINGSSPPIAGSNYDQVETTGTVDLTGSSLILSGSRNDATAGDIIVLVKNGSSSAVTGTFTGLAEGATVALNGCLYSISYIHNADGGSLANDVALTSLASADYFWDADGDGTVATGGAGTWDASALVWRTGSPTGTLVSWATALIDTAGAARAIFQDVAGAVAVDPAVVASYLSFTVDAYSLSGSLALSSSQGAVEIAPGMTTTIGAVISGSSGLEKFGAGTLVLSGTNTYTGSTTIAAGVLQISADANLGAVPGSATPASIVITNGTLEATATFTLAANRGLALEPTALPGAGTISVASTFELTYGGIAANIIPGNSGGLTKIGPGALTLSGTNTYTGVTTVTAGTLAYGANDAIGSGGVTVNGATALLSLGAFNDTVGAVILDSGGSITGSGGVLTSTATFDVRNGSISANLAGNVGLTKSTAGAVTLSGSNTYTGLTTINSGSLTVSGGNAIPDASGVLLTNATGAVLNLTASETVAALFGGGGTGGNVTLGSSTLTVDTSSDHPAFAGAISGTGGLTKAGSGIVNLTGVTSYTGATNINAGVLKLAGTTASSVTVPGSAFPSPNVAWTFSGGAAIETASAPFGITTPPVAYPVARLKSDSGTLVDSKIEQSITFPAAGDYTITFNASGRFSGANAFAIRIDGIQVSATIVPAVSAWSSYSVSFSIPSAGAHTLAFVSLTTGGTGGGDRTTFIDDIVISANGLSALTVTSGAFLDLTGGSQTIGSLAGAGTVTRSVVGSVILTTGNDGSSSHFAGTIQDGSGSFSLVKIGAGTQTLSGANTYTGATAVTNGTITATGGSAIPDASAITVGSAFNIRSTATGANVAALNISASETVGSLAGFANGAVTVADSRTLSIGGNNTSSAYSGIISGAGGLTKIGVGTLTLSGVNGYTGPTLVSVGTVKLLNTSSVAIANAGFENTTTTGWTIGGASTAIISNADNHVPPLAPEGGQALRMRSTEAQANVFQTINFPAAGDYTLSFYAAGRASSGFLNPLTVKVDGVEIGGALPVASTTAYTLYTIPFTVASGGAKTLQFLGVGTGADRTSFVDNVAISGGALSAFTVSSGAFLDVAGTSETIGSLAGAGTVTRSTSGTGTLRTGDNDSSTSFTGVIQNFVGTIALTKAGAGTFTLGGAAANTYSGATTVSKGTLSLTGGLAIRDSGAVAVSTGATLNVASSETIDALTGTGSVTVADAQTLTVGANNASGTFLGVISGASGGLVKSGTGSLMLAGVNTYAGATTVSGGILRLQSNVPISNSSFETPSLVGVGLSVSPIATPSFSEAAWSFVNSAGLASNGSGFNNGTAPNGSQVVFLQSNASKVSQSIYFPNTGTFVVNFSAAKRSTNTPTLVVKIDGATVMTIASGSLPTATTSYSSFTTASFVISSVGNHVVSFENTVPSGDNTAFVDNVTITGTPTFGIIPDASAVTVAGSAVLDLAGLSETVGSLAGGGTVTSGVAGAITLTVGADNTSGADFSGAVQNGSGTVAVTKTGSGSQILSGTNTYTGATAVNGGTLLVNGQISGAGGAVTVDNPGTILGGTGDIDRAVTVYLGATLAPGASIGTLGVNNDLTLPGVSSFEVTGGSGPLGASDKVDGVNVLTYGGTLKITNVGGTLAGGDSWNLFDFSSQSGTFDNNSVFGTNGDNVNLPSLSGAIWQFDYGTGILSVVATLAAPTVASIVPAIGPTTGGTMLLINGSNFVSITSVTIDGTPLATFSVSGTTQISVTTPSHAAGAVDVVVANAGGTGSLIGTSDFTYATPAVASVVVNGGPGVVLGGSTWSLAGQHSVVKQILVMFNQAVTVASDAFTVTPVPVNLIGGPGFVKVNGGAAPSPNAATTTVTMLTASTYLVTFVDDSGDPTPSTHAGGLLNSGVYDLTTIASKVTANGESLAGDQVTTFFAMFGTIDANDSFTVIPPGYIGDGFSNAFVDPGSLFQFSDAFGSNAATPVGPPAYNIVFDANLDGFIDPGDLFAFSDAFGIDWDF